MVGNLRLVVRKDRRWCFPDLYEAHLKELEPPITADFKTTFNLVICTWCSLARDFHISKTSFDFTILTASRQEIFTFNSKVDLAGC